MEIIFFQGEETKSRLTETGIFHEGGEKSPNWLMKEGNKNRKLNVRVCNF